MQDWPRAAPALVGRDGELGELLAGLDDVTSGTGRLFLLAGDPGIGKSRPGTDPGAQPDPRRSSRRHHPHRHVLLLHARPAGPDHLAHLIARISFRPDGGTTVPCPVTPPG